MFKPAALSLLLPALVALCACGGGAATPAANAAVAAQAVAGNSATQSLDSAPASNAQIVYCEQTGGKYELRNAVYGTNGPNPLPLANWAGFCRYTAKDTSRIYIKIDTLYAVKPTLAVLAYLAKIPTGTCQGNPASCYCTLLGGSDQFGGTTGAGGGWVLKNSPDPTLEACIFPDLSSIDSWGLAYHANNIIRGRDLSKVVRYGKSS